MATLLLEHPVALFGIAVFAISQVATFLVVARKVNRLERKLKEIHSSDPRLIGRESCAELPFVAWCREPQRGAFLQSFEQRRELAMADVDQWFTSLPSFQVLQRAAHVAPLLGVLITAFGFLGSKKLFEPDGTDQLLHAVSPLVIGIAGGACLAIMSQAFLFAADVLYGRLRVAASMAFNHLTSQVDQCPAAHAFECLADVAQGLKDVFSGVPASIAILIKAANQTSRATSSLGNLLDGVATQFERGVDAFTATVKSDLAPALLQHVKTVGDAHEITNQCKKSLAEFGSAAGGLEDAAKCLQQINSDYASTLQEIVLPSNRQLSDTAKKITAVATTLGKPLESLLAAMTEISESIVESKQAVLMFSQTAGLFEEGVRAHFLPAVEEQAAAAAHLGSTSSQLKAANQEFGQTLKVLAQAAEAYRNVGDRLIDVVEEKAVPANEMLSNCAQKCDDAASALAHYAEGYSQSVVRHAGTVDQLSKKVAETIDSYSSFGDRLSRLLASEALDGVEDQVLHIGGSQRELLANALNALRDTNEAVRQLVREQNQFFDSCMKKIDELTNVSAKGVGFGGAQTGDGLSASEKTIASPGGDGRQARVLPEVDASRRSGVLPAFWQKR
jgi:methyl-accepting chemotaxis protein